MRPHVLHVTRLPWPSFPPLPHRSLQLPIICFQICSSSSRMRGFPWAPTATCTFLTPSRTTAARTTTATPPSPNYAPSSRRSPWPSQSGAVGLQNTRRGFDQKYKRTCSCDTMFTDKSGSNSSLDQSQNSLIVFEPFL